MSNFYACDPWAADWSAQLKTRHAQLNAPAYLLVDCGFSPAQGAHWLSHPEDGFHAIYQHTALAGAAEMGLFLGPAQLDVDQASLESRFAKANSLPMFSWIWSYGTSESLTAHLSAYVEVETGDGSIWPLRFGDSRCMADIYNVLKEAPTAFDSGYIGWSYFDRTGRLTNMEGAQDLAHYHQERPSHRLKMTDASLAKLIARGETDEALMQLVEMYPDLPQLAPASALYDRLQKAMREEPMKLVPLVERLRYWHDQLPIRIRHI